MKICIQSGTPLGTSDLYRPYYESLLRHAKKVARPDTVCERYKVTDRMVPGGYVTFAFTDYANLWGNPQPFVEEFMRVARDLVRRGATALYPAGLYLSQWLIDQGIREVEGAIVMDPLAIGIKTAELMVDLESAGIKRYRTGRWAIPSEEVRNLLAKELGA